MRALRFIIAVASLAALGACGSDGTTAITTTATNIAFTRFVNAVADSGAQDWRFIDVIENSPTTFGLAFRGTFPGAGYQATGAGSRHLRLFQTSTDILQTQKVLFDTTFTFTAGTHYTLIAAGNLRPGAANPAKLYILTDDFTDPGASVALRVVNAGAATSVDVYGSTTGGTTALPASPLAGGVAAFSASKYLTMSPGALDLRVFSSGSTTFPAMIDAVAPAGLAADRVNNLTAVGGSTQAGSVFTAFLFPRSVAGSAAANFTTPGVVYMVDKQPPSGF
ncbi:MAG: hypothetical protein JWM41_1317 [Gemmatimonadetes bacterium]|nr:hypothetical protein [Gemmatimonadota bacterium]